MGNARDFHQTEPPDNSRDLSMVFPGDPISVRKALKRSMAGLRRLNLTSDEAGVVEIVLAEVLNNIVEHAYRQPPGGIIELCVRRNEEQLRFQVLDDGVPMPGESIPNVSPAPLHTDLQDLPEGGFGWLMIKELTKDLRYSRSGPRNRLEFTIALSDTQIE